MKICHIADLHVRALSRHDEYKVVFEKLISDLQEKSVDYLFIGGDIYHTKTQNISPEYIDFMTWFFTSLSRVTSTHMILGNHDMNLSNLSRQDAVTPIINALKLPNIFLYKNSGVYEFHPGFNWCVFSLFDPQNWESVSPKKGMFNIACYHGPVYGSMTESSWMLEDGLKIEFFDGYDLVLLGDIHRQQFLDFSEKELIIDESELSAYPNAEIIERLV